MMRTLPVCAVLLALPLVCQAETPPAPTETVIRITVRPMPAPKPALRYQLLPELREMNPGNPIQGYLKCFMEQNHFFHNKEAVDKREKWLTMPLKDLPIKEMQYYRVNGGLRQADYAARLDTPDWQILLKLKSDGINLLLPDVQRMRALAGGLKVRFRVEIAERRFDDALVTAKTMLALSRHVGDHPTLIGELVGISIAAITLNTLDEMIQQPGCPNLYWALTDLPTPFIDLHKGMQGERVWLATELAGLDEQVPMTEAQMRKIVEKVRADVEAAEKDPSVPKQNIRTWLNARVQDEAHVRAARNRLVEHGLTEDKVNVFPPLQVILLDEKRESEVRRDERMKAMALPYWQAAAVLAMLPPRQKDEESLLGWLARVYDKIKLAQARIDQRIGLLRCVEALRLHAAEHDGKLPAKLADIALPLPVDPITGKPFVYQLNAATAAIRGTPPRGLENNAGYNIRYEVTIGK